MDYLKEYEKIFNGGAFLRHGKTITINNYRAFDGGGARTLNVPFLAEMKNRVSANILDFGCGESLQWHRRTLDGRTRTLTEMLGNKLRGLYRYDPCVAQFNTKPPKGCFDIILCADVMEHIPEADVPKLIQEINSYGVEGCVIFYSINTTPSNNLFLDGTNMHITQKEPEWWDQIITQNSIYPSVMVYNGVPHDGSGLV